MNVWLRDPKDHKHTMYFRISYFSVYVFKCKTCPYTYTIRKSYFWRK